MAEQPNTLHAPTDAIVLPITRFPQLPEGVLNGPWWYVIGEGEKHPRGPWKEVEGVTFARAYALALSVGGRIGLKMDPSHEIFVLDFDPRKADGSPRDPEWLDFHAKLISGFIRETYVERSSSGVGYHVVGELYAGHPWQAKRSGPTGSGLELFTGQGIVVFTLDSIACDEKGVRFDHLSKPDKSAQKILEALFPSDDEQALIEIEAIKPAMAAQQVRVQMRKSKSKNHKVYDSYLFGPKIVGKNTDCSAARWDLLQWAAKITDGCEKQLETLWEVLEGSWLARTYTPSASKANKHRFTQLSKIRELKSGEIPKAARMVAQERMIAALRNAEMSKMTVGGKAVGHSSRLPPPPPNTMSKPPPPPSRSPEPGQRAAQEPKYAAGTRLLNMVRVSDVDQRQLEWLWPDRVANGKVSLFAGHGGIGKSQLTAYMAAKVTTGGTWPNSQGSAPKGSVIMLSSEDDIDTTIGPRLTAAGADTSMVHVVKSIVIAGEDDISAFSIEEDMSTLRHAAKQLGDVKLITIDPVTAYLGGVDTHKTSDTRASLLPIQALAEELDIPILLISHFNKSAGGGAAANAITGSGAFVHVARSTFAISPDPEDPDTLLLMQVNNNLGNADALTFSIEEGTGQNGVKTSMIVFNEGTDERTADEVLNAHSRDSDGKPSGRKKKRTECIRAMREFIGSGAKPATEVHTHLDGLGFSKYMIDHLSKEICEKKFHGEVGSGGRQSYWSLMQPENGLTVNGRLVGS